MSQQIRKTLQAILDAIEHPCCIKENNMIVLTNVEFIKGDFDLDKLDKKTFYVEEKNLDKNLKICEIKLNELKKLSECRQKITQALALL